MNKHQSIVSDICYGCFTLKQCWFINIKYLWLSNCPCSECLIKIMCNQACELRQGWSDEVVKNPNYISTN